MDYVSRKPLADVVVAVDGRWNRAGRRFARAQPEVGGGRRVSRGPATEDDGITQLEASVIRELERSKQVRQP
jgi:hypothetical protein